MENNNTYKNQIVAILAHQYIVNDNACGIFDFFNNEKYFRVGLYNIEITKDDIYNTLNVKFKPNKTNKYQFHEINYNIYEYDNSGISSIVNIEPNKYFDIPNELFKAQGFVDFVNELIQYKEKVESNPYKFYIKLYNSKIYFRNNKWYKDYEEIHDFDIYKLFFKIDWEYDSDKVKLKTYNIFKRIYEKNFRKNPNILENMEV